MKLSDAEIVAAMHRLGLTAADFALESEEALAALQERAQKAYRKAVAELHPDKNNGDKDKELQLIALGVVMEEVKGLRVAKPPQKKLRMSVRVRIVRT